MYEGEPTYDPVFLRGVPRSWNRLTNLNLHGAAIGLGQELPLGGEIIIRNPHGMQRTARVVMLAKKADSQHTHGIEFLPPNDPPVGFWGIQFPAAPASPEQPNPRKTTFLVRCQNKHILNVDDVESHRYSITRLLTRAGFQVSEAATGGEAIRRALECHPDLVLLDIHLPDTTGYEVCERLKASTHST